MAHDYGISCGSSNLTTSAVAVQLTRTPAVDGSSGAIPDQCHLDHLHVQLPVFATATTITAQFALDAAGDVKIGDPSTKTIRAGATTATKGAATWSVDLDWRTHAAATSGSIWVLLSLDAGTATGAVARLTWRR